MNLYWNPEKMFAVHIYLPSKFLPIVIYESQTILRLANSSFEIRK